MTGPVHDPARAVVSVDELLCIGAGLCVRSAPTTFAQDEDGVSRVVARQPDLYEVVAVEEAVGLCPVQAIGLRWR